MWFRRYPRGQTDTKTQTYSSHYSLRGRSHERPLFHQTERQLEGDNLTSLHVLTSKLELRRYLDTFSASPALAARRKLLLLSPCNITHARTCTRWEGYGDQRVCVSICMSICSNISNNARQNFTKFSIHVTCDRRSIPITE